MDLTVCHKQIAEEWRQQIIVVAKHKFSSNERIDLINNPELPIWRIEEQYVLDIMNFL